jgi:hypothetical protein
MNICQGFVITAIFLVFSHAAGAAVYKTFDEQGNVVYTDDPVGHGEPLTLPPLSTVPPPRYQPAPASQAGNDADEAQSGYQQVAITSPTQDETLRDNTGDIWITASVEPALDAAAGDRLQYFLDGQTFGEPGVEEKVLIPNLPRGTHTVSVAVVGPSGTEVKRSEEVRFYLHRQSVNFPRGPGQPTPR